MQEKLTVVIFLLLLSSMRAIAQQEGTITFTVSMEHPELQRYHVVLQCTGLNASPVLDFKMPSWMPGYYQLLDYAAQVEQFQVRDGAGREIKWEKTSASVWRVPHQSGASLTVEYDIRAAINFVARPWLDSARGYIAPAGVFLYVDGYLQHPVTVGIRPAPQWAKIATGLDPAPNQPAGINGQLFTASDFDILYDCPILIGNLEELPSFVIKGIPHYFTGYKLGELDGVAFMKDLAKIVQAGADVIGDIPYRHYTFLAIGPGRGGIEHLNSTTIGFSSDGLKTAEGRKRLYGFIAHEYFHHYNVKRIRPIALGPFDYDRENRTNMLWVSEGLTVYYEYLMVRRAGLMSAEDLLQDFQSDIAAIENKPGHLYQSLAQSSYETWSDGPFGRTGDSVNKTISYYQKGPAIGLLLDLAIRHATENKKSLDDVMRSLYRSYYQEKKRGFTDDEFRQVCERTAGVALPEIFDYVYTVKEPDYAKYLAYGGMGIDLEPKSVIGGQKERSYRIFRLTDADALQSAIRKDWLRE